MNRLLSILVTLFILFLVYLWIHHLMGSKESKTGNEDTTTEIMPDSLPPDPEYHIPDDVPAGVSEEYVEETNDPVTEEKQPEVKEEPKATPAPPPVKEAPKTKTPVQEPPAVVKASDTDSGVHLVIAGNFLARANAEERVRELKKLGYANAEVVNFELSEYHTACAGRYSDMNEARRVAKKIKDLHGIDTYVRHGN